MVYRPTDIAPGHSFTLTVAPFESLQGQQLASWFEVHARNDLAARGRLVRPGRTNTIQDGVLTQSNIVSDSAGKQWLAFYSGMPTPDGRVQFASMVSDLPASTMSGYVRTAATFLAQTRKAAMGGGDVASSSAPSPAPPPAGTGRTLSADGRSRSSGSSSNGDPGGASVRVATPGTGLSASQIAAVIHEGRGVSTPMGFQYQESADLLLNDGWEYSNLELPPEDLDVEAARRLQPDRWHRWRKQSDVIYIEARIGQWTKLDGDYARPLEPQLNLHLIYRRAYTFGGGGMGSYNTTNGITFMSDGHFERASNVLAGTGVVQAGGGFSGGTASHQDRNGSSAVTTGTYSGGGSTVGTYGRSRSNSGNGSVYGTYKVSGYVLELDSADGQVQRLLAFHTYSNKPDVYLNGQTYYPPR